MGDSSGLNPFNTSPEHQKTNNQSIPSHISPHFQNFPPQFSHPFQHQFPRNFNPYSMPPYHPYGGYPPRMPYDSSFNLSPGGVFGRGVINEGALSSSPVESMAFGRGVGALGTASPISPEPQINDEVQELSDNSDVEENRGGRMNWTWWLWIQLDMMMPRKNAMRWPFSIWRSSCSHSISSQVYISHTEKLLAPTAPVDLDQSACFFCYSFTGNCCSCDGSAASSSVADLLRSTSLEPLRSAPSTQYGSQRRHHRLPAPTTSILSLSWRRT